MRYRALTAVLVTAALPLAASATVLVEKSLEDIALQSTAIVRGTVTEVWTERSHETDAVYTYAEIEVQKWIAGASETGVVQARALGGTVGDLEAFVPGAPRFQEGEDVILFLDEGAQTFTNVVGWAQGSFHVVDGVVVENGVPARTFVRRIEAILENASR